MKSATLLLSSLLLAMYGAAPADAAHHRSVNHRAATQPQAPNQAMLAEQVLLAQAGFSPGVIDGRGGENTDNALHAFQQANGLPVGTLDAATQAKLAQGGGESLLGQYTTEPADVAGPFAPRIPTDFTQMAQLPALAYGSPRELLAEKFHVSEALLAELNPGNDFAQAGSVIAVPRIAAGSQNVAGREPNTASGSSAPPEAARAAQIVVDKRHHAVLAYGADQRLIAFYPASIGSGEKPAPSGSFQVRDIARDPAYTYNPAYNFRGQSASQPVTVRPGPNNPVGLVWIGLSAKGYGIHGTADPEQVGKTQSHGCVRLTNWDALALAKLVKKGTPVVFVG